MNNKLTLTALAIAALGVGLATSAPARAGLLDQCQINNSRQALEKCCSTWISQMGKPMWFTSESTCGSVVACRAGRGEVRLLAAAYVPKCRIEIPFIGGEGSTPPTVKRLR